MIIHHRARPAGSPRRLAGLPAQIQVAPTSTPPATSTVFSRTTHCWGGLNFTPPGNRPSLTSCVHARVDKSRTCGPWTSPTPIVGSTGTRPPSSPSSRNARRALLRAAIRAEVGRVEGLVVGPRQPDPTDWAVVVEWAIERSRRNVDLSHTSSDAHRSAIRPGPAPRGARDVRRGPVGKVSCCDRVMPAPLANAVATCLSVADY